MSASKRRGRTGGGPGTNQYGTRGTAKADAERGAAANATRFATTTTSEPIPTRATFPKADLRALAGTTPGTTMGELQLVSDELWHTDGVEHVRQLVFARSDGTVWRANYGVSQWKEPFEYADDEVACQRGTIQCRDYTYYSTRADGQPSTPPEAFPGDVVDRLLDARRRGEWEPVDGLTLVSDEPIDTGDDDDAQTPYVYVVCRDSDGSTWRGFYNVDRTKEEWFDIEPEPCLDRVWPTTVPTFEFVPVGA